jgi:uncharacterized phage protein gp47/JayE
MVVVRSLNEIILSLIDFYRIAQPNLDTKPATVARDLLIDAPSNQLALLYDQISQVSTQQSLQLVTGSDLDKLAKNFGITRKSATASSGVALITFSSIPATIGIGRGDIVTAANGISYSVVNGISVSPTNINFYRSTATKFRNDLDFVGITDQFAVEVTVQSTTPGTQGNIGKYSLNRTTTPGASNVTNTSSFLGGNNQEDDATFRNRVLSVFSGSSIGTALGYRNLALSTTGVTDAFVVEPGNPLMTRDGSVVSEDASGNLTVISEGTGGKVDIVILGTDLVENTDSFIYRDKSNKNDPTDPKNTVVLGQITGDENKTINRRRIDNIKAGTLPSQPVDSIIQVSGSGSGSNFKEQTIDSFGRVSGNYKLVKDTGSFAGSPFGFDSFIWTSDRISLFEEDRIKGKFNGQDAVTFSDVSEIPIIQQNISITNENSTVLNSDRSLIQLLHFPAKTATRVFNSTTGERYTVLNQNPNGSGTTNTSGVIKISGNTLPSQSDVLQVDYTWVLTFDQFTDYDGRFFTDNLREVTDSIDWGYSNLIRDEEVMLSQNDAGTYYVGNTTLPIGAILTVNSYEEIGGVVSQVTSGTYTGRLSVVITNLINTTTSIDHVLFRNTNVELFKTSANDGLFTNASIVVGIDIQYTTTIILPSDTKASIGDTVTVIKNSKDTFNVTGSVGNFNGNQVTVPLTNFSTTPDTLTAKINYIANVQDIISTGITSMPVSRVGNGFGTNSSIGFNNVNIANVARRENQVVQKNTSNQFYIELNAASVDVSLSSLKILTVIRLSDIKELWNQDNAGTIEIGTSGNYQLIFTGFNTPAIADKVLVIYYAEDVKRFQPFTFSNDVFSRDFGTLQYDITTNKFSVPLHTFIAQTGLSFEILEKNSDDVIASGSDGYITTPFSNLSKANFSSLTVNFDTLVDVDLSPIDITSKRIRIFNSININNNNYYEISSYNENSNIFVISNDFSKINKKQISVIRVLDGKELWSDTGTIDVDNNLLLFTKTSAALAGDDVMVLTYDYETIKQSPTKLILTVVDSTANTGTISVNGTTITKAKDVLFSATSTSLKQNLFEAIRKVLGLNSNSSIPSTIKLVKITKLERVSTEGEVVLLSQANYDLLGLTIQDNSFYSENIISNTDYNNLEFSLPSTQNNVLNLDAQVKAGDKFRITFYYSTTNDTENVIFTRNGTLYTNKAFALIDKVYISSGFNSSQSTRIILSNFNQPITGSRYKVFYDYMAPKQNERIIIKSNNNRLVSTVTFNVETNRPINADVLIRQAKQVDIDVTMNVVISDSFKSSSALVLQNLKDKLVTAINANALGTVLDSSSLVNAAFSVDGVAGARIIFFNKTGSFGQVLSLTAKEDEYFSANLVTVAAETR